MTEAEAKSALAGDVSRETLERLTIYADLLIKWQKKINLVAPSTIPMIWSRHMLDSAQLFAYAPAHAAYWLDIGSGGGFPGLVCAAIAADHRPNLKVALVESDQRKATFLREAARHMGLSVTVHGCRINDLDAQGADVVSARALAPLRNLCEMAHVHLGADGICLFQKGVRYVDELEIAKHDWHFNHDIFQSVTEADAVVMRIERLQRA